jgi:glycosyltransferase involved in cell wall biosynthesis
MSTVACDRVDLDFTLAIYNRTGKYFIGVDLMEAVPDMIGRVYYGAVSLASPPNRLFGAMLGRMQYLQTRAHVRQAGWMLPRRHTRRVLLHMDPFTVGSVRLREEDVVLCHDIGPITHPDLFDGPVCEAYRAIYREVAEVRPHMVFVSRASQKAFHLFYPDVPATRSRVIYPAIHARRSGVSSMPASVGDGAFLLTVGSIGRRKNQLTCIRAFAASGLAQRGVRYVICGSREPGWEEAVHAAETTPGVLLLPYVSDAELAWLYEHASGLILASRLEGFGMPVAEAIAHGLVPAVTRDTVLEEVAGPGALLVDDRDEANIADALVQLVEMDPAERRGRVAELQTSIGRFSPEKFAREWRAELEQVLASAGRSSAPRKHPAN